MSCAQLRVRSAAILSTVLAATAMVSAASAAADNRRLNDGVVANVYTVQRQADCDGVRVSPQLRLVAQWHANDVINNRYLNDGIGSDGSTAQDRANAAGYRGRAATTVAINPALSITGLEVINQWYRNPTALATMRDCTNTDIGVWSENWLDRTVVVAVYGKPETP